MKYSCKGYKDRNRHKKRIKKAGKLRRFTSKTKTTTSPPREGEPVWTYCEPVGTNTAGGERKSVMTVFVRPEVTLRG